MTVSSSLNKIIYQGDGTTKTFSIPFYVLASSDIQLSLVNIATQEETVVTSNYTVNYVGTGWPSETSTITYPVDGNAVTDEYDIVVLRYMDYVQETTYSNKAAFSPKSLEKALDKMEMQVQQLAEESERAVKVGIASDDLATDYLTEIRNSTALAETSATNASISEVNALASENSAAGSAVSASASATSASASVEVCSTYATSDYALQASASAISASESASLAETYSNNASGFSDTAETYATSASNSATTATEQANNASEIGKIYCRQNSTEYSLNAIVLSAENLDSQYILKCTTAGTTDSTSPTTWGVENETITDGTVVWTITLLVGADGADGADGTSTIITASVTLSSASWSSSTYTISNANITSSSIITLAPSSSMTSTQYDAIATAKIIESSITTGQVVLKALGTVPTVDCPVVLIIEVIV